MLSPKDEQLDFSTGEQILPLKEEHVIPLIAEQLEIGKRTIETGTVRLTKHTEQRIETVEAPLTRVRYEVEHVPIDRVVVEQPAVRYEGDTTIYPVVEEHLIVTRELRLREEVRVTRISATVTETTDYRLLREEVRTERDGVEIGRTTPVSDPTATTATIR